MTTADVANTHCLSKKCLYTDIQKELHISIKKIKELIQTKATYNGLYKFNIVK